MIKLKEVIIDKYKVFTEKQVVKIEDDLTALVGLNESGKTAFLEVLAKLNYFDEDPNFAFNPLTDFPRSELKTYEGKIDDIEVVLCKFEVTGELLEEIEKEIGKGTLVEPFFYYGAKYNNWQVWRDFHLDMTAYLNHVLESFGKSDNLNAFIETVNSFSDIAENLEMLKDAKIKKFLAELYNYVLAESYNWDDPLKGYIAKKWFKPNLPKFWYFDEYYSLPSRIKLNDLLEAPEEENEALKTARALFKLAKINITELIEASDFERFIAELENTANIITEKIYRYWSTNSNLELEFEIEIEKYDKESGRFFKNVTHHEYRYLNIRIRDKYNRVSLPLHKRSKGFNWFFSFIVWFSQIEKKTNETYVLLLDEPGLNLHAVAQKDLLLFLRDLSADYQLVYTTHSPFMLSREDLSKIRTISDKENGSFITVPENETDYETLLPIQVAIGYEVADSLLMKKRNLVVETVAEFMILQTFSEFLNSQENKGLHPSISITPLGGFSNVIKFVTLMSGYNIDLLLLFDDKQTPADVTQTEKALNKLATYSEFTEAEGSTVLDLFAKEDFLKLLYSLHPSANGILEEDNLKIPYARFVAENIEIKISLFDFANAIVRKGVSKRKFAAETLSNFEKLFAEINARFAS
jgi:predicted ATP-dependent endonuclease of OLD family